MWIQLKKITQKYVDKVDIIFLAIFFFGNVALRLYGLEKGLMVDEPIWLERCLLYWQGITSGHLVQTLQSSHPGVPTMITGGFGFVMHKLFGGQLEQNLLHNIFSARLPIVIVLSLFLSTAYLQLKILSNRFIAITALLFMTFDTFILSFTRLVHVDGYVAVFGLNTVLATLLYLKLRQRLFFILSGIFGGLALLSKTPSLLLLPVVTGMLFVYHSAAFNVKTFKKTVRDVFEWGVIALIVIIVLWPVLWVDPMAAITYSAHWTSVHVVEGHNTTKYIFDPWYYLIQSYFFSSPLIVFSSLLFFIMLVFKGFTQKSVKKLGSPIWILLVTVGYLFIFTLSAKKGERYILPAYVFLPIMSAYGIYWLQDWFRKKGKVLQQTLFVVIAALLLFNVYKTITLAPYFLTNYNPLFTKPEKMKMGFGEGLNLAAEYLSTKEDSDKLVVASWYPALFEIYFNGVTIDVADMTSEDDVDYVVLYKNMQGREPDQRASRILQAYKDRQPEKIIYMNDLEYVWIYKN